VTGWLGTGVGMQGANLAGGRVMANRRDGAVVGGDRVDSRSRAGTTVLTGGARLPEGERGVAADGWGRPVSGRGGAARAWAVGPQWAVSEGGRTRARERVGRKRPSRGGGRVFFFSFYFLSSFSS
jgi:hypothetical protein